MLYILTFKSISAPNLIHAFENVLKNEFFYGQLWLRIVPSDAVFHALSHGVFFQLV